MPAPATDTATLGDEGAWADRGAAGAAVVGALEVRPPRNGAFTDVEVDESGWNCEAGTMLYPGSPRCLMCWGTTDSSVPGVAGATVCARLELTGFDFEGEDTPDGQAALVNAKSAANRKNPLSTPLTGRHPNPARGSHIANPLCMVLQLPLNF
jgi:hypothetical protein